MQPDRHEQLERLIDRTLRDQPLRRAPAGLEAKVMAHIAQHATLPWWRKGFAAWPTPARWVFFGSSIGFAWLAVRAATWIFAPIDPAFRAVALPAEMSWIQSLMTLLGELAASVPSLWVYAGIGIFAGLYAVLFGVGAAAYRTLYAPR